MLKDELEKLKELRKGLKDVLKLEYNVALSNIITTIEKANLLEEAAGCIAPKPDYFESPDETLLP